MSDATREPLNWCLFLTLWLAGTVAALPLIPVTVLLGEAGVGAQAMSWQNATMAVLAAALVVFSAAIYVGLRTGRRFGLGVPLVAAWLAGEPLADAGKPLATGALTGGALGLIGVVLAVAVVGDSAAPAMPADDVVPLWVGVAQALSAGVGEELLFRLGLMSVLVAFVRRVIPGDGDSASDSVMWTALALTAVMFTAVHGAPGGGAEEASQLVTEPMQMLRLVSGVLFGWLFWKHGLEAAVAAHFTYDMVLFYGIIAAV
jgi:membrane protease YdiL (CAAX protease family)